MWFSIDHKLHPSDIRGFAVLYSCRCGMLGPARFNEASVRRLEAK